MAETTVDPTEQIRQIIDERVAAVRAKDPEPLMARAAPDLVTFDVLPPMASRGSAALESKTRAWFDGYATDIGYDVTDLNIWASGDLAFCSYLYRISGTLTAGAEVRMVVRATVGFERIDGQWQIVHGHDSVPFDPETGKAVITGEV